MGNQRLMFLGNFFPAVIRILIITHFGVCFPFFCKRVDSCCISHLVQRHLAPIEINNNTMLQTNTMHKKTQNESGSNIRYSWPDYCCSLRYVFPNGVFQAAGNNKF